jgi:hypothetical protein
MALADYLKGESSEISLKDKILYGPIDPKLWDNFMRPFIYFGSLLVGDSYPADFLDETSE